ncbi:hypothetical protein [Reyranella sp.]|uniref:hypothetical protein n=1 Tax=Reyranella sp. TaxID=1929291 RepID=UPI003BAD4999
MAKVPGSWEKAESLTGPWAGPSTLRARRIVDDPGRLTPDELSIVSSEQFDRAFEEYSQLGPRASVPIEERWPEVIPDVDPSKYPALEAKCHEITWAVVQWDDDVKCGRLRNEDDIVKRMVAIRYPYLTPRHQVSVRSYASFANR